jgi:DNA-binding NtrC family response regulator
MTLSEVEKEVIQSALKYFKNNKKQTSEALGIAIRTLDNKLAEYEGKTSSVSAYKQAEMDRRIKAAMIHFGGNLANVSQSCGISLAVLDERIKHFAREVSDVETKSVQANSGKRVEPTSKDSEKQPVSVR